MTGRVVQVAPQTVGTATWNSSLAVFSIVARLSEPGNPILPRTVLLHDPRPATVSPENRPFVDDLISDSELYRVTVFIFAAFSSIFQISESPACNH
jgi:hypothetical protein